MAADIRRMPSGPSRPTGLTMPPPRGGRRRDRSPDCWIAQLVIEADGVLVHDDDDLEGIASSRPLRTLGA